MAAKKTPKDTQSKAAFIRSHPSDMPAKEVVAKAAEVSLKLSEGHVHAVRASDRAKAKKNKAAKSDPAVATKPAKKSSGKRGRKSKIVIKLVAENPAWTAEQVAKAAGCSVNYVYSVKRDGKTAPAKTVAVTPVKTPAPTTSATTIEFYRLLKRIGIDEAKQLIAGIEAYERA